MKTEAKIAAAVVLAAFLAVGCSGCVAPGDDGTFLDPGDYQPPTWEQVNQ